MMALSGVRSSCDMLARNSDLWRLAASSSRLFSSSSRNRRAFWMARVDWVAKVRSRPTSRGAKRAGGLARQAPGRPAMRSSRSSGTARTARNPSARQVLPQAALVGARRRRCRRSRTGSWTTAARPMAPSPSGRGRARTASTKSGANRCGGPQVEQPRSPRRTRRSPPASAPESWTACETMVVEHRRPGPASS